MRLPLRTQLLLVTVAISTALTATSLLVVRHSVFSEVNQQILQATQASVDDFVLIQQRQVSELQRSAAMLSELPTLKSLMTTNDRVTIEDASAEFRELSDADLLLLANPAGELMALHVNGPGMSQQAGTRLLASSMHRGEETALWQDGNRLYRVVTWPIIAGAGQESHSLGLLALGKRIDDSVAKELGNFAGTEVVLAGDREVFASTQKFDTGQLQEIYRQAPRAASYVNLGNHHYAVASIELPGTTSTAIRCYLLLPLSTWDSFLARLNRMILILGIVALLGGALLVLAVSRAIIRPLDSLVSAVHALASGNYEYSLQPGGSLEIADLGAAFNTMRMQLLELNRKRLDAERLAALGRAAGSISHDLRHHLAIVVANAEFLYSSESLQFDRNEIYAEIRRGSAQMTELIDSLVEIARERPTLNLAPVELAEVFQRAAEAVRARPEFRECIIDVQDNETGYGQFDVRKLQRAFLNLLLNACESTDGIPGNVRVTISAGGPGFECRVSDHGKGVPESIRDNLFEPFVSAGKANGTGLGLAIARKIIEEHGGTVTLESTSQRGSIFLVTLPRATEPRDGVTRVASGASLDAR